jgi:hypothetical protein
MRPVLLVFVAAAAESVGSMPWLFDDFDASMRFRIEGVESLLGLRLGVLPAWKWLALLGPNAARAAARARTRRM